MVLKLQKRPENPLDCRLVYLDSKGNLDKVLGYIYGWRENGSYWYRATIHSGLIHGKDFQDPKEACAWIIEKRSELQI